MRVLIVFAALVMNFGCGSAPANNTNANRSNSNVTLANSNLSTSNVSNSTMNSTSNLSSNSMSNSRSNTSTVSNTAKSNTTASNTTVAGDKKIKGNKASKIYHLPGCPDYDSVSAANVVTFNTEQEARKAGYKIAGNCK